MGSEKTIKKAILYCILCNDRQEYDENKTRDSFV